MHSSERKNDFFFFFFVRGRAWRSKALQFAVK